MGKVTSDADRCGSEIVNPTVLTLPRFMNRICLLTYGIRNHFSPDVKAPVERYSLLVHCSLPIYQYSISQLKSDVALYGALGLRVTLHGHGLQR